MKELIMTNRVMTAALPLIWNRPRLRYLEGAPEGGAPTPPAAPETPPTPTPTPTPVSEPPKPSAPKAESQKPANEVSQYEKELRAENAERRIAAKEATQAKEAAEKRAAELEAQLKQRDLNDAVRAVASDSEISANAKALLDSSTLQKKLSQVDPGDTEAVKKAVKEVLEAHPEYKTVQVPRSSGSGTHTGGGQTTPKREGLAAAVANKLEQKG